MNYQTNMLQRIVMLVLIASMTACSTIEDVNRAATLNRMDSNLPNLIKDVSSDVEHLKEMAKVELLQIAEESIRLAIDANGSAALQKAQAIGFYRVAATAAWQSESKNKMSMVFNASNAGLIICNAMQADRPDRDCFYLALVPTYVAAENALSVEKLGELGLEQYYEQLLNGQFSDAAKLSFNKILDSLRFVNTHVLAKKILSDQDEMMLNQHPSLLAYYCKQSSALADSYNLVKNAVLPGMFAFFNKMESEGVPNSLAEPLHLTDEDFLKFNDYEAMKSHLCL